jgi:hypothetical protein
MPGDILTVWIKTFRLMELAESGVNTIIPWSPPDICVERDGGNSQSSFILPVKPFDT